MDHKHVYLNNRKTKRTGFKRRRSFSTEEPEEQLEEPTIKAFQVSNLRQNYVSFTQSYQRRNSNRTIEFPAYIDLIEIRFFPIFNKDLKNKFFQKYGLFPVCYFDFNRTVVFEVANKDSFENFKSDIEFIVSLDEDVPYSGQEYNLVATIYRFRFINQRANTNDESIALSMIQSVSSELANLQKARLKEFLAEANLNFSSNENEDIFYVENVSEDNISSIERNFDIVQSISSSRALNVRPGMFGTLRMDYGFEVEVPEKLPIVGVIDTGVDSIEPYRDLIVNETINITGQTDRDFSGHGTLVAGLVIFGTELPLSIKDTYRAKCKILPIKVLHFNDGGIDFPKLLSAIRYANQEKGVRIFNMSLGFYPKKYNESFSDFAYELDCLSHQLGVLIFISVGNFDAVALEELLTSDFHDDHDYPNFFYKLDSTSPVHRCENTNICVPSESINNISIGAIAANVEEGDNSDFTPINIYPAYYTRKFHFDYNQKVNTSTFKSNQRNKHLNKPDLVFDGGDLKKIDSGIEVLGSPSNNYYLRTSGTSLSAPLVASIAAEIEGLYPDINSQSIKALLVSSANYYKPRQLPHFQNSRDLLKKLIGFGIPDRNNALLSSNNSITMVIEDSIKSSEMISIPIYLPDYLKEAGNKLVFNISLAFSSLPDKGNHLGYQPLHMSFNLMKNLPIKKLATLNADETVAKRGFSWSEDHFGKENIFFSNVQKREYKLQPRDIISLDGQLAIAVRCLSKENIDETLKDSLERNEHNFSLVIRLTEEIKNTTEHQLYSEMQIFNDIIVIGEAETDADLNLETS
ncbi:S8 family peptidase [Flagellimonas aurea]|uniref:S8 family peptidase n=1 Tax=Flagellimonas aurea TaxID=2915619 RepID=UPI0035D02F4A